MWINYIDFCLSQKHSEAALNKASKPAIAKHTAII